MSNRTSIEDGYIGPDVPRPADVEENKKSKAEPGSDIDVDAASGSSVSSDPAEAAIIDYKTLTWWYVCSPAFHAR
jgi:hypothetical protein